MNVNYGLFPPLADVPRKLKKRDKNERLGQRALSALEAYAAEVGASQVARP